MILFLFAAMIGAVLRYLVDYYLPRHGILFVNILGSLIAGSTLTLAVVFHVHETVVQATIGGFAGSLTTFSTVAVATAEQHLDQSGGAWKTWARHVALSITACLCGVFGTLLLVA